MLKRSVMTLIALVFIGPALGWAQPPGVRRIVSPRAWWDRRSVNVSCVMTIQRPRRTAPIG